MSRPLLSLVRLNGRQLEPGRAPVDAEVLESLREMIDQARRGEVTGFAWVAVHRDGLFTTNAVGDGARNPVFAAGMVSQLLHDLHLRARGELN